jgi:hypothetical protein
MKTKYRSISNGHWDFLQYEKEYTFLFFFKRKKWVNVWKPYYDKHYGRGLDITGADQSVTSLGNNLEEFAQKWPNIEDYFQWASLRQTELVMKVNDYWKERNSKKGKITNLN